MLFLQPLNCNILSHFAMNPIKIALGAVETLNVQTKSFLSEDGRLAQFS